MTERLCSFLIELRNIAVNRRLLPQHLYTLMKRSPILLASRRTRKRDHKRSTGDIDEEELEEIDEKLELDYQIGEDIKEKVRTCPDFISRSNAYFSCPMQIIPHAVDWFTGKALQFEDFDEDDDDFEDLDDEDDDEDAFDDDVRSFSLLCSYNCWLHFMQDLTN